MDSQDWNVNSIEGTEDIQSGNSSEVGCNNSGVGGNEDLDLPDSSQKEEDAPRHPVTHILSKGKSYVVKRDVVMTQSCYDLLSRSWHSVANYFQKA